MKKLVEIGPPLIDEKVYKIAKEVFDEKKAQYLYGNHHIDAIAAGADAAGISFYLFQAEMTRRNSLSAYYKRERKKAATEASKKKAEAESIKKEAEKKAFEKQMKKVETTKRQMNLFPEETKLALRDRYDD